MCYSWSKVSKRTKKKKKRHILSVTSAIIIEKVEIASKDAKPVKYPAYAVCLKERRKNPTTFEQKKLWDKSNGVLLQRFPHYCARKVKTLSVFACI